MKKILVAFDKFKFTLTADQVTEAVNKGISYERDELSIQTFPLADGGEGTADILSRFYDRKKIDLEVFDPLFRKIKTHYYYIPIDRIAFMDLSAASGLFLLNENERDPLLTSTFGTGEMILHAINSGAKKINIGLGGSATNDAGIGAAVKLGYKFLNKKGKELISIGKNLKYISEIDDSNLNPVLKNVTIDLLCDADNILYGTSGAAFVYSEQKGASKKGMKKLNAGLKSFSDLIQHKTGRDISGLKSGGAAGGFGAGAHALLNANLLSGSDAVLRMNNFDSVTADIDLILTGEGKFDKQSFQGKITGKIIEKANQKNIPVIIICGQSDLDQNALKYKNILSVNPLFFEKADINKAKHVSTDLIIKKTQEIFKKLKLL